MSLTDEVIQVHSTTTCETLTLLAIADYNLFRLNQCRLQPVPSNELNMHTDQKPDLAFHCSYTKEPQINEYVHDSQS